MNNQKPQAGPASRYILRLRDVKNYYYNAGGNIFSGGQRNQVLKGVNLDIKRGEIFGLVGESGCGKSTLGRAIVGLIEAEGSIILDDRLLGVKRTKETSRQVQIVFQDPLSSLNPKKKIGWILEEPLRIHKIGTRAERRRRVDEVLELVGLAPGYRDRYPRELSGGQRQRISIGSALMLNPKLIVADEPVSALDVSVQSQILNLMADLHKRLGLSYLFISHNLNVVYYLCDRIAVMYKGAIVELSDVESIYDRPMHPYTRELLRAIPKLREGEAGAEPAEAQITDEETAAALRGKSPENGCAFYARCPRATEQCAGMLPSLAKVPADSKKAHYVACFNPAHD